MQLHTTLLLAALFSVSACVARAQFDQSFATPYEAAIQKSLDRSHTPGFAVSIVHNGIEVYSQAFGVRDFDTQEPLATTDLFHWASVTKPFVATAAMQLVEQGKLDLDEPITTYLPYFRMTSPEFKDITSRLLLTHTAGMPDVSNYEWDKPQYDDEALERWVRSIADRELLFTPTSGRQYSNIGFEVMGDVIAKVSGMPFESYVAQNIFTPLKMNSSTLLIRETNPTDRVSPHTATRRLVTVREHWPYNRRHSPSSTLITNVHDLGRWAIANLNHGKLDGAQILEEEAYEELWNPSVDIAPTQGLSWFLGEVDGHRAVGHGGSDSGFRTEIRLFPELNLGISVATNTDRAPFDTFIRITTESALAAVANIE
jgi:CubicO group peptidase (beta-lactamase class C family)